MSAMDIDGVIFDLGSTLIENENIPWEIQGIQGLESAYNFLIKSGYSVPPPDLFIARYKEIRESYREKALRTLEEWCITDAIGDLLRKANIDGNSELIDQFFVSYYKPTFQQLTIFPDTALVLDKLKKKGKIIGLVSNTIFPESYHLNELRNFKIIDFFDFTIFSSSFGYRKPHVSIYQQAIKLSGIQPERLLFVGDRYAEDYVGPRECGLHSILRYCDGRDYPDSFPDGTLIVKSLSEILLYIPD